MRNGVYDNEENLRTTTAATLPRMPAPFFIYLFYFYFFAAPFFYSSFLFLFFCGTSQQRNRDPFQAKLCVGNHLDGELDLGGGADGAGGGDDNSVGRTVEDGQEQGRLSRVWLVGVSK